MSNIYLLSPVVGAWVMFLTAAICRECILYFSGDRGGDLDFAEEIESWVGGFAGGFALLMILGFATAIGHGIIGAFE